MRWFDNENRGLRSFWHPIASVAELDSTPSPDGPHAVRLIGEDFTLVRLDGEWAVLPAACPHRRAPLHAGQIVSHALGSQLQCAYHGWCFAAEGTCTEIPALGPDATIPPTAHLAAAAAVEQRYGLVWVALDDPLAPIPEIPEWDDPRFGKVMMATQVWNASAAQMADNFLDVAHFPFTHLGTIGDPDDIEVHPFDVQRDGWSFSSVHHHRSKVLADATSGTTEQFTTFDRTMSFRCDAPHHVRLHIDYGDDGNLVLMFFHRPVDVTETAVHVAILAENIADGRMPAEDHIAFQTEVGREDRELLEQLAIKAVSLDPGAEVHTRADRSTLELRRLLSDIDNLVAD